jgi:hypothetical protein
MNYPDWEIPQLGDGMVIGRVAIFTCSFPTSPWGAGCSWSSPSGKPTGRGMMSSYPHMWLASLAVAEAFMTAMATILVSMILYGVGLFKPRAYGWTWAGWICLLVTLISMTAVRLHLRDLEPKPYLKEMWVTHDQWGFIAIFLVLLVAGFGTVGWMLLKVFGKKPAA